MPKIVASFEHYGLAHAVCNELRSFGISVDEMNVESIANEFSNQNRYNHLLQQGNSILIVNVLEDDFIFVYEVVSSFGGDFEILNEEVFNLMYQIPEESYEQDVKYQKDTNRRVGSIGYPNDLLDDDAFIDPNIGIGDYDLLTPIFEQVEDEYGD